MSRARQAKQKETAKTEPPSSAVPIHTMPLPEVIALKDSQRLALNALNNDEARMNAEIQQLEQQIAQRREVIAKTQGARLSVLAEIEGEHKLEAGTLGANYQYDGQQLIKVSK